MPEPREEPTPATEVVQSLVRGLEVIRSFDAEHPSLSLSEVSKRAGISPAAAGRFLRTLETLGYVRTDGRLFSLTPRVLELGFSYLSALSVPEVLQPHLAELSNRLGESASAAVRDGSDIVYVARAATRRIMSVRISIGTRFPATATSMGRALLAFGDAADTASVVAHAAPADALTPHTITDAGALRSELSRVREQGYAVVDEELELGLRSIAVPVRDGAGAVVAAVNVSTSTSRATVAQLLSDYLPELQRTAAAIETELRVR